MFKKIHKIMKSGRIYKVVKIENGRIHGLKTTGIDGDYSTDKTKIIQESKV